MAGVGVGASLVMEKVPPRLRGVFSGCSSKVRRWLSPRGALLLRGVPALGWRRCSSSAASRPAALYVRFASRNPTSGRRRGTSPGAGWAAHRSYWKLFLYLVALMTMMNFASHGTQDLYPTFLQRDWGFTRSVVRSSPRSRWSALLRGVLCGLYSDRLGRRRTIVLALAGRSS